MPYCHAAWNSNANNPYAQFAYEPVASTKAFRVQPGVPSAGQGDAYVPNPLVVFTFVMGVIIPDDKPAPRAGSLVQCIAQNVLHHRY
jgi:hypothetical protein